MKTAPIDRQAAKVLQSFAEKEGIVAKDEQVEIFKPTFRQRIKAAGTRKDLESPYDVFVLRKAGEDEGTLVNLLRADSHGTFLNALSGFSKLAGVVPGFGPLFQAIMGGTTGMASVIARWLGHKLGADNALDARVDAGLRFAANQLAFAGVGFAEDALLSPVLSPVVRGAHNVPSAIADFKDIRRGEKEGPSDFVPMSVEQVAPAGVGTRATKLEPPPPITLDLGFYIPKVDQKSEES